MYELAVPESNLDTEVRKTKCMSLSLTAEHLACNNMIDFN